MAMVQKKNVEDLNVAGKKVIVRVDFNVPLDKVTGEITDDKRIKGALPTIKYLVDNNAKVILVSHLGRPKNGPEAKFSMKPAASSCCITFLAILPLPFLKWDFLLPLSCIPP